MLMLMHGVCVCVSRLFCRAAAVRQELPAPVDQLPAAGHQAGQVHAPGGADHHPAPRSPRQQVIIMHLIRSLACDDVRRHMYSSSCVSRTLVFVHLFFFPP